MPCFIYIQDETIRLQMNIIVHSISVNQILLKASLIFFRYVARDVYRINKSVDLVDSVIIRSQYERLLCP